MSPKRTVGWNQCAIHRSEHLFGFRHQAPICTATAAARFDHYPKLEGSALRGTGRQSAKAGDVHNRHRQGAAARTWDCSAVPRPESNGCGEKGVHIRPGVRLHRRRVRNIRFFPPLDSAVRCASGSGCKIHVDHKVERMPIRNPSAASKNGRCGECLNVLNCHSCDAATAIGAWRGAPATTRSRTCARRIRLALWRHSVLSPSPCWSTLLPYIS
jgi:hypothetical protein